MELSLSTFYHPQSDGQYEGTIHMLEDLLCACDVCETLLGKKSLVPCFVWIYVPKF